MNYIPNELCNEIFNFLYLKDIVNIREVNKIFKLLISEKSLIPYKFKSYFIKINSFEITIKNELVCEFNYNNFIIYKKPGMHYYFKILGTYDKCVSNCNSERLGYIYHSLKLLETNNIISNKRYIPYCIHCFLKWEIKRK